MRLLIQPGAGVEPLVKAIDDAKEQVEIAIFRFNREEIETALLRAVERGVFVHALIANTNRGGEKNLRQLETRLLAKGVTVSRTADDLTRYHAKYIIVDRRELLVLAFNFTSLDMEQSRSFGMITNDGRFVSEAVRLFDADSKRQPFETECGQFVVSPVNARKELAAFIAAADNELLIYDLKVGDPAMIRLLRERVKAGVTVRVIGRVNRTATLDSRELRPLRLHTRTMIRDRRWIFLGSQSLRASELEVRREVGIIFEDPETAGEMIRVFEADWKVSGEGQAADIAEPPPPMARAAKKLAKAISKHLPPIEPVIEHVRETLGNEGNLQVDPAALEENLKKAVRRAVEETIEEEG